MFTVLSNTRTANLYLIGASALVLLVILSMVIAPSVALRGPAVVPVTGSQNAYVQFLSGEKAIYASPAGVSEALPGYHIGEKTMYSNAVDASTALSTFILGEKVLYASPDALSAWRQGEKDAK